MSATGKPSGRAPVTNLARLSGTRTLVRSKRSSPGSALERAGRDRRKQLEWPLSPGYCFARFDDGELFLVLNCSGVATVVSFNGDTGPDSRSAKSRASERLIASELRL